MTNEEKLMLAVDRMYVSKEKYDTLSAWEKSFLQGIASAYKKSKSLSIKQKNTLYPILKKHNVIK